MSGVSVLEFEIQREVTAASGASGVDEGTNTEKTSVVLGDELLVVQRPNARVVYDFHAARVLKIDDTARTYRDDSLYSIVGLRVPEWGNRHMIHKITKASGAGAMPGLGPSDLTDYFGLAPGGLDAGVAPQAVDEGGCLVFRRNAKTVVRVTSSSTGLSAQELRAWRRFLAYECHLHPEVRRRLLEAGRAPPGQLETHHCSGPEWVTTTLTLSRQSRTDAPSASVPEGYTLASERPRPIDALAARIDDDEAYDDSDAAAARPIADKIESRSHLEAFLLAHVHFLQTGRPDVFALALPEVERDARVRKIHGILQSPPQTENDARRAIKQLKRLRRKARSAAFVLDIYMADLLQGLSESDEAEALFLAALEENPRIAGVWSDLGRLYHQRYHMEEAWQCWDTARRLYPEHPMLKKHDDHEMQLRDDYPDFF